MSTHYFKSGILALFIGVLGGVGGYFAAGYVNWEEVIPESSTQPQEAREERKALYWYDPMFPQQHFDQPGKSPFMDMQLVPKYAGADADTSSVQIDTGQTQNIAMRLATVTRGMFAAEVEAVGTLTYNERDVAIVQTRTSGFVERVHARAPGDVVAAGAPLADILVPEWAAAQNEFLALLNTHELELIGAARQRLKLLGMSETLIKRVEDKGKPQPVITISTPIAGVIQSLEVRAGMTLAAGQTLAQINGLATVWLDAAVPAAQSGQVKIGDQAEAELTAWPGEIFTGQVIALLPEINTDSRTLRVRIELPNPDGRFRPGMYAGIKLRAAAEQSVLQVPSEAVIRTGRRALVMLVESQGRYRPVEVETGPETGGMTVIFKGLEEGQEVVASGQFLIDSEANLQGIMSRPIGELEMMGEEK